MKLISNQAEAAYVYMYNVSNLLFKADLFTVGTFTTIASNVDRKSTEMYGIFMGNKLLIELSSDLV
jgi:hypothetical protein